MRYRVHGISRTTGKETTLLVNAKHHEAAHAIASRQVLVSEVIPEGGLAEPEVFDPRALDPAPELPVVSSVESQTTAQSRRRWVVPSLVVIAVLGLMVLLIFLRRRGG